MGKNRSQKTVYKLCKILNGEKKGPIQFRPCVAARWLRWLASPTPTLPPP